MKLLRFTLIAAATAGCAALLSVPAANFYYRSSWGAGCTGCHEIRPNFDTWSHSSHRKQNCEDCHSSSTLGNLRRVARHAQGDVPEQIRLRLEDVATMMDRCQACHQQEFAQWRSGPHSVSYAKIFTDPKHNHQRQLIDDCLRCHGMHYSGGIRDVVQPLDTKGPWRLADARLTNLPAIPCLACHSIHREGQPLPAVAETPRIGVKQEIFRPSLSLTDRRSQMHLSVQYLPVPIMLEGPRQVHLSADRRQALCYQCHAPLADRQVASGDDRTPIGVHEGMSCLACHQKHGQNTRASCADCHPRLSNCGIDVEKMDTTFLSPSSKHNVHFVKCVDCHTKGVPPRRKPTVSAE